MKKSTIFKGAATALITPTNESGVDYKKLKQLIDWQIDMGINGLVICGTTGEAATLTYDEYHKVVSYSIECVNGRVPAIIGTGSNNTADAVEKTKFACREGADAVLTVTPYYNKTTQNGLVKMYETIADATYKPVILYNVPSRTGVGIAPETYLRLAEHPMIWAIKEAGGDLSSMIKTMSLIESKLDMYSGNDDQVYSVLSLGGMGVISVLSNVAPKETVELCNAYFSGDMKRSKEIQFKMLPLISALFSEVNPIPVKAAMAKLDFCDNYVRLPLVTMSEDKKEKMYSIMDGLNLSR